MPIIGDELGFCEPDGAAPAGVIVGTSSTLLGQHLAMRRDTRREAA
jgi:hypothetical protein